MQEISQLGQYGLIGVMLALIALTGSAICILWKLVGNHIDHSTQATTKMTETLTKLTTLIEIKLK